MRSELTTVLVVVRTIETELECQAKCELAIFGCINLLKDPPLRYKEIKGRDVTLQEIDNELPNGLHDARIRSMKRDLEERNVVFELEVFMESTNEDDSKTYYKNATMTFTNVELFVIEMPDSESPFIHPGNVWFKATQNEIDAIPEDVSEKLSKKCEVYTLYVLDWLSYIKIAATGLSLSLE